MTKIEYRTESADAAPSGESPAYVAMKRQMQNEWKGEAAPAPPQAAPQGDARETMKRALSAAWKDAK
jgi:hypothetical protein